jgi:hypothetical protein
MNQFLGVVQLGQFQILWPQELPGGSVRLTAINMQESVPPESKELKLTKYEGSAVMIRGHQSGSWIYSAETIDEAGPILTTVVQQVFGKNAESIE